MIQDVPVQLSTSKTTHMNGAASYAVYFSLTVSAVSLRRRQREFRFQQLVSNILLNLKAATAALQDTSGFGSVLCRYTCTVPEAYGKRLCVACPHCQGYFRHIDQQPVLQLSAAASPQANARRR